MFNADILHTTPPDDQITVLHLMLGGRYLCPQRSILPPSLSTERATRAQSPGARGTENWTHKAPVISWTMDQQQALAFLFLCHLQLRSRAVPDDGASPVQRG